MAVSTRTFFQGIAIPVMEMTEDKITSSTHAKPTTAVEGNFDLSVTPASTNQRINGQLVGNLVAVGTPTASGSYDVAVQTSGAPDGAGGLRWKNTTDATTLWRGQTPPWVPSGVETIRFSSSAATGYRYPRGVRLPDDSVLFVEETWVGTDTIDVRKRTVSTRAYSTLASSLFTPSTAFTTTDHPSPDICRDPESGELFIALIDFDTDAIRVLRSTDSGTTWTTHATAAYSNLPGGVYNCRLRYDVVTKSFTLLVHRNNAGTYTILHLVSIDGCATFQLFETITTDGNIAVDLGVYCGTFYMVGIDDASDQRPTVWKKSGASQAFTKQSIAFAGVYSSDYYRTQIALEILPNGTGVIYLRIDASDTIAVFTTQDWRTLTGQGVGSQWYDRTSTVTHTTGLDFNGAVSCYDGILTVGNYTSTTSQIEMTAGAILWGGISDTTRTQEWRTVYDPIEVPQNRDWTQSGGYTGVNTMTSNSAGDKCLNTTYTAQTGYYSITPTKAGAYAIVDVVSGGILTGDDIVLDLSDDNGTGTSYRYKIRFAVSGSDLTMRLVDGNGVGATLADATLTGSLKVVIQWHQVAANVLIKYKALTGDGWSTLYSGSGGTGLVAAVNHLKFGSDNGNITAQVRWLLVAEMDSEWQAGFTNPTNLSAIPAATYPTYIAAGVNTVSPSGQLRVGDTWTIETDSRTGIRRALPNMITTSPRENFQGGTHAVSTTYYVVYDMGSGYRTRAGELIGIAGIDMDGIEALSWERWTGAAWSSLFADLPCYEDPFGATPSWTRDNTSSTYIRANGTNSTPRYMRGQLLDGLVCQLRDTAGNSVFSRVVRQTEGQFTSSGTTYDMRLDLDPTPITGSGTFAALGTSGSGGSSRIRIFWDTASFFASTITDVSQYYRLGYKTAEYPTSPTPKIGKLAPFRLYLLGRQESPGAQHAFRASDPLIAMPNDLRRGRRDAPPSRAFNLPLRSVVKGYDEDAGGTEMPALGYSSTPRMKADNVIGLQEFLQYEVGQQHPLILFPGFQMPNDFGTGLAIYGRKGIVWGWFDADFDVQVEHGSYTGVQGGHLFSTALKFIEQR